MVYSINSTTKDKQYGWESVTPTKHTPNPFLVKAENLWHFVNFTMIDNGGYTQEEIIEVQTLAKTLQDLVTYHETECTCRNDSAMVCKTCKALLDYRWLVVIYRIKEN